MKGPAVHIGYHKTGTTYLQNHIYPYLQGLNYVDRRESEQYFSPIIEEESQPSGPIPDGLYSFEGLIGALFDYRGEMERIAEALKRIGFEKIIITIREPLALIDSAYRQWIQQGASGSIDQFLSSVFKLDYLDYPRTIRTYQELFGIESVLVLTNEELKARPEHTVQLITEFLGVPPIDRIKRTSTGSNISISNASVWLLSQLNSWSETTKHIGLDHRKNRLLVQRYLDPYIIRHFSTRSSFLTSGTIQRLRSILGQRMESTRDMTGLPLGEYGYL